MSDDHDRARAARLAIASGKKLREMGGPGIIMSRAMWRVIKNEAGVASAIESGDIVVQK